MLSFNVYIASSIISILVYELGEKVISERLDQLGLKENRKTIAERLFKDLRFLIPVLNIITAGAYFFHFEEVYENRKKRVIKEKIEKREINEMLEKEPEVEKSKPRETFEKLKRLNNLNNEIESEKVLKKRY